MLQQYREQPDSFSIQYRRCSPARLSAEVDEHIRQELQREKELVENRELPISGYNYAVLNDRLKKEGIKVSTTTLIKRAIQQDCYLPKKRKTERHDREVLTSTIGDLIQHDAPYTSRRPMPKRNGPSSHPWMTTAACCCMLSLSKQRRVGRDLHLGF